MLATYRFGTGESRPLLIAHGLYGSARNWGVIGKKLAEDRQVVTVDMRNHGASPWYPTHSYEDMADDLAGVIASVGKVDLLGHSMGGKAAMLAALRGAPVGKLIVADIAPVAYAHSQLVYIHAMRAVNLEMIRSRAEADEQLKPRVEDPTVRSFLLQSLDMGEKRWRLHLDALEAEMPKIMDFPLSKNRFEGPTLFLSGGRSEYVQREHRPKIKGMFPAAQFAKIPDAGHWLHAEKPRQFMAAVRAFLGTDPEA